MTAPKKSTVQGRATPKPPKEEKPAPEEPKPRLSVEALTNAILPVEELELDYFGGTVLIQGFSGKTSRIVREETIHRANDSEKCTQCGKKWPCPEQGMLNEDVYEKALVLHGLIDPKLTEEEVDILFDEQFSGVGRLIAMSVLALNAAGRATHIAKSLGQTMNTDSISI